MVAIPIPISEGAMTPTGGGGIYIDAPITVVAGVVVPRDATMAMGARIGVGDAVPAAQLSGTQLGFGSGAAALDTTLARTAAAALFLTAANVTIANPGAAATAFVQVGSLDAFARRQIWGTQASQVLRLGADTADGDAFNADSEGIVIYNQAAGADRLGRIKADRFGLTRATDSSLYYFRVDETSLFYRANPPGGTVWLNIDRTTGVSTFCNTPNFAIGNESIQATRIFAADGAYHETVYIESLQTGGAGVGNAACFGIAYTEGTSSTTDIVVGNNFLAVHGGSGVCLGVNSYLANFGVHPLIAGAVGLVTDAYGFRASPDALGFTGGSSSSFTRMQSFKAEAPFSDAMHTIGTMRGFWAKNQGKTGITDAIALDIEAQSGASGLNLGMRLAASHDQVAQAVPPVPPAGSIRLYTDLADGAYKAEGPSGLITIIANP